MRGYSASTIAALESGRLSERRAVWFTVKDRSTGADFSEGYWFGTYARELTVFDVDGTPVTRTYYASGSLIELDPLPRTARLQVKRPTLRMSHVNDRIVDLVREYDPRQAEVLISRVLLSDTGAQVDTALAEFIGRVNTIRINEPKAGEPGSIEAELVSSLQEINRKFSATRSSADQKTRNSGDAFFNDNETAAESDLPWGRGSDN